MAELLKDLYNENYIDLLCNELLHVDNNFNANEFKNKIFETKWKEFELNERMRHTAITLGEFLPQEYAESIDILKTVFNKITPKFALENMIFQDFVEVYGIEYFEKSMAPDRNMKGQELVNI